MGRHQHVRKLMKREPRRAAVGVFRGPVLPPNVEGSTAYLIAAQGMVKGLFLNDRRAADIDQQCGGLHQRQAMGIDQPSGLRPEAGSNQNHIPSRQHTIELAQRINLGSVALVGYWAAIGGDHCAAEAERALCYLAADPAIADDPDGFPEYLAVR